MAVGDAIFRLLPPRIIRVEKSRQRAPPAKKDPAKAPAASAQSNAQTPTPGSQMPTSSMHQSSDSSRPEQVSVPVA